MTSDIRFRQLKDAPRFEVDLDWWVNSDGLLDEKYALQSAVIVALGTDALARPTDKLPDLDSTDRRGWWGDMDAEEIWGGWPVGSRLWLLRRAKITGPLADDGSTVARADTYAREAIRPFVQRGISSAMSVGARRVGRDRIDVLVTLFRGPNPEVELQYSQLWDELP